MMDISMKMLSNWLCKWFLYADGNAFIFYLPVWILLAIGIILQISKGFINRSDKNLN